MAGIISLVTAQRAVARAKVKGVAHVSFAVKQVTLPEIAQMATAARERVKAAAIAVAMNVAAMATWRGIAQTRQAARVEESPALAEKVALCVAVITLRAIVRKTTEAGKERARARAFASIFATMVTVSSATNAVFPMLDAAPSQGQRCQYIAC